MAKIKFVIKRDDGGTNNRDLEIVKFAKGNGVSIYHHFPDSNRCTVSEVEEATDPIGYQKLLLLMQCMEHLESPDGVNKVQALLNPEVKK